MTKNLKKEKWRNLEGIKDSELADYIVKISQKYDISEFLIYALIKTESSFRYNQISNTGAIGLTQVEPMTAQIISQKYNIYYNSLYNPYVNILIGVLYLKYLINYFNGNVERALTAYNYGMTKVIECNLWTSDYASGILECYNDLQNQCKEQKI